MKETRNIVRLAVVCAFAVLFLVASVPTAKTYPPFLTKAKSMGFAANDCTYCHINAAGGEPYNARGKWLIAEKGKRGASAIDVAWLKEYKAGGKGKATARKGAKAAD